MCRSSIQLLLREEKLPRQFVCLHYFVVFSLHRLRTLSSGGGNTKSPSGAKTGGTAEPGGAHHHSPLKHSQSYNSFVSPPKQLPTPTAPSGKKFPLATHRYGKEELLLLFSEDTGRPDDVPNLSPLTKLRLAMPLSFMPLTEEEQVGCVCSLVSHHSGGVVV